MGSNMLDVGQSANYAWRLTNVLGKGTFGTVFQGESKHNGEPVAVKTFNQLGTMPPQEVQRREFEVLKKVKHENIVKLLAIEKEQNTQGYVIIMELCEQGSLHDLLQDPKNRYGLPEDVLLLLLSDLTAAIKYLRENKLVHRDLKPSNIMKFIPDGGQVCFKLTDFGAARELEEAQEFYSFHGTAEYCHPDMYELFLSKPTSTGGKKAFSASVDLWSIGVTLYHAATGFLPFRPYGGRQNKEMMHFITTTKQFGVISGWQHTENGEIEWKRELPTTCQISNGLKRLITPLLAGLMEVDKSKMWTYDMFFNAVAKIMAKTRVHVFYLNKVQTLRVYMDPVPQGSPVSTVPHCSTTSPMNLIPPCEIVQTFQKLIQEQTGIIPENQIILHQEWNPAQAQFKFMIPQTSEGNPVIVCDKQSNNVAFDRVEPHVPKFPIFEDLENIDSKNDPNRAKWSLIMGYSVKRKVKELCLKVHLMFMSVETIKSMLSKKLTSVKDSCAEIQTWVSAVDPALKKFYGLLQDCLHSIGTRSKDMAWASTLPFHIPGHSGNQSQDQYMSSIQISTNYTSIFDNNHSSSTGTCISLAGKGKKAQTHVEELRKSCLNFLGKITTDPVQFLIEQKTNMHSEVNNLIILLNECKPVSEGVTDAFFEWYKLVHPVLIQTEILAKDVTILENLVESRKGILEEYEIFEMQMSATNVQLCSRKRVKREKPRTIIEGMDQEVPEMETAEATCSGTGPRSVKSPNSVPDIEMEAPLVHDDNTGNYMDELNEPNDSFLMK